MTHPTVEGAHLLAYALPGAVAVSILAAGVGVALCTVGPLVPGGAEAFPGVADTRNKSKEFLKQKISFLFF